MVLYCVRVSCEFEYLYIKTSINPSSAQIKVCSCIQSMGDLLYMKFFHWATQVSDSRAFEASRSLLTSRSQKIGKRLLVSDR